MTSVSPSSFLLFAMSEFVCVSVFLSAPDAAALPWIQCTLQTVSSDGFFCAFIIEIFLVCFVDFVLKSESWTLHCWLWNITSCE